MQWNLFFEVYIHSNCLHRNFGVHSAGFGNKRFNCNFGETTVELKKLNTFVY